jgi:hypothetical protein
MPPTYAVSPKTGIPKARVNPTHDRRIAIHLFFGVSLAQARERRQIARSFPRALKALKDGFDTI